MCKKLGISAVESGYYQRLVNWFAKRDVCGLPGQKECDCDIDVHLCSHQNEPT